MVVLLGLVGAVVLMPKTEPAPAPTTEAPAATTNTPAEPEVVVVRHSTTEGIHTYLAEITARSCDSVSGGLSNANGAISILATITEGEGACEGTVQKTVGGSIQPPAGMQLSFAVVVVNGQIVESRVVEE